MEKAVLITHNPDAWTTLRSVLSGGGWGLDAVSPQAIKLPSLIIHPPAFVFLDMMIPSCGAWDILEALKHAGGPSSAFPVFCFCGEVPSAPDIIRVLDLGAEDLISRDIHEALFLARLRSCRRKYAGSSQEGVVLSRRGGVKIDKNARWVQVRTRVEKDSFTQTEPLTPKEFDLLYLMVSRQNHVWTRESLLSVVWGAVDKSFPRTVDKHIETLRVKLGPAAAHLKTVPGVGYKFCEEDV